MQPNRLIYGAWGLLLVGAAVIAIANSQADPEAIAAESETHEPAEAPTRLVQPESPPALSVTPASFAQDDAPRRLPVVSDTDPLAATKLKELRRIVAEEMPSASSFQLDVWTEQFADMPEDAVRLMLQQRRELMGLPSPTAVPNVAPVGQGSPPPAATIVDVNVITDVRDVVAGNLANAHTTGYRRRIVEFSGAGPDSALNIAEVRFDMTTAPARYTGRAIDLATETGFFAILDGEQTWFTRAGRFSVGNDRHLVLLAGERQLRLAGLKPLPENCVQLKISDKGIATATADGIETELGKLRLATFLDASRLRSQDGCLFAATTASGAPNYIDRPQVKQHWLEPSNVEPSTERRLLDSFRK